MIIRITEYTGPGTAETLKPKVGIISERAARRRPLGDLVEKVAQPIARSIDSASADITKFLGAGSGTKLAGCSACNKRRGLLNRLVPDIRSPKMWARGATTILGRKTK